MEPVPFTLSSKLGEEPVAEVASEPQPIPDAAAPNAASEPSAHRSAHPDKSAARITGDLVSIVDELLGSLPGRVVEISGWIGKAVDRMARAVSAAMTGLLGGQDGAPGPVDEPLVPVPAAPAPAAPIPVGSSSFAGGSFSSWTLSSAADHEELLQLFAVLVAFSRALMQGGELRWITREALAPNLLARPPNERPG